MRVLVLDDDADTVLSLVTLLRLEGFDAKGVTQGIHGLVEVEAFDPDVVIVDIAMPQMSGWDVARELRIAKRRRPVLIAISGTYVKRTDVVASRAAGFSHFLQKPCNPDFLFNILAAIVPGK
jgi:two-component system OmpR family response regulator